MIEEPQGAEPVETAPAKPQDGIGTLTEESRSYWAKELDRARKLRAEVAERFDWQGNLDRYAPPNVKTVAGEVNVGADFSDVERKKAALLFARPDVGLTCDEPQQPLAPPQMGPTGPPAGPPPMLGALVSVHQELLNELLGPCHIDIQPTALKTVFDVLCPAGIGAVKVGYQATTVPVEQPVLDPMTQQPAVDPLTGQPVTQPVDVPIHEEFYVTRLSPMALLLPADWKDTDTRKAPWLGYEWQKPVSQVRREYGLPEDWEGPRKADGRAVAFHEGTATKKHDGDPPVTGCTIEYRAMIRGLSPHPDVIWTLTLVDGQDEPLEHKPSPYQTVGEDARLTPDSIKGFSIRTLALRDLSDSAWVPSDCAVTGPLTRELNKYRTQNIEQRDNARQVLLVDTTALTPEAADKIKAGKINSLIPVEDLVGKGGADNVVKQVATASLGRENYLGQDYIERDRAKVLGIDSNMSGAQSVRKTTATESNNIQRNTEARFEQERQRVQAWYLDVVRQVDALLLKFGDARLATGLIGPRKGQLWAQFKQVLGGGYRYEMQVDSGKYLDIEANRRQWVQVYQMTRQDPKIKSETTITKMAQAFGIDPMEWLAPPPPPQPPQPSLGVSIKGEDLVPYAPQYPSVYAIIQATNPQLAKTLPPPQPPPLGAMLGMGGPPTVQTAHGGPAQQQMPISKRQADETGGTPNGPASGAGSVQ